MSRIFREIAHKSILRPKSRARSLSIVLKRPESF
jgi:hypothetical protein